MSKRSGKDGSLYQVIEPYRTGWLDVSGGHRLVYELCGNPAGIPVVVLHGGPGAGCTPTHRRYFDPDVFHIVLFDQRGAGRSRPYASIHENTTQHLVEDIEAIRGYLGIERWLVFGGSWGSTLALVYATRHPASCLGLILRGVWLCRPGDLEWWFDGLRSMAPDYWESFAAHIPESERNQLLAAYYRRLVDPDPAVHGPAAAAWCLYEERCSRLRGAFASAPPVTRLSLARIEAHYMRHRAFLRPGALIQSLPRITHLPCVIIHGRFDLLCPLDGAVEVAQHWPNSRLVIVPNAGHAASEQGIQRALVRATEGMGRMLAHARPLSSSLHHAEFDQA